ncbi:phage tail protein, partial [Campylobacter sp. RM12635]|nr:phage tail protein [Campylobacter sp. RM12635]
LDENTASLTNIKYENLPTSVRIDEFDNSKIILEAVLKNDTAQDFFINCVGFVAKNEELLCFTKTKRTPVLSKATDANTSLFHYKLAIELTNANDLSIKIDETIVYPTLAHFNASQKAQDELIAKLGLDKVNTSDFTASQNLQDEKIKTLENTKADKAALNNYYTKTETYTKAEIDKKDTEKYNALNNTKADKAALNNYYTKTESNNLLNAKVDTNTYITEQNAQNTRLTNLENSRALKTDLNNYYTKTETYTKAEVDTRDIQTSKVVLKSTRNSSGIWTITNLIINKPLIITASLSAGAGEHSGFAYSVLSGTLDSITNGGGSIVFSCCTHWDSHHYGDMSSSSFTIIPNDTSVSIKMNMLPKTIARAYQ